MNQNHRWPRASTSRRSCCQAKDHAEETGTRTTDGSDASRRALVDRAQHHGLLPFARHCACGCSNNAQEQRLSIDSTGQCLFVGTSPLLFVYRLTVCLYKSILQNDMLVGGDLINRWQRDHGGTFGEDDGRRETTPLYYLGIIDILQEYNLKKKMENLYKGACA